MKKIIDEPYDVFLWYFNNGLNKRNTLKKFKIGSSSSYSKRWANYKRTHLEDFKKAKEDYFDFIDITEEGIIQRLSRVLDKAEKAEDYRTTVLGLEKLHRILTSDNENALNSAENFCIKVNIQGDDNDKEE